MNALVTGASGFLGANVVKVLLAEGVRVRALVLPGDSAPNLDGFTGLERVAGEVTDRDSVRAALSGCDIVFHLAAIYKLWLPDASLIYRVNIDGTRIVLEEAWKAGVERIVHTSSAITCGFPAPGEVSDETSPYETEVEVGNYRTTKYLSEQVALDLARRGAPVVIVNPTVPVGWGDLGPTPTGTLVVSYLNGLLTLAPDWSLNVVGVRDVARGHVLAARKGRVGEKYLLGGENLGFRQILEVLDDLSGFGLPMGALPPRFLLPVAAVAELFSRVTGREPVVSRESARAMTASYVFDVSKARDELGLVPEPVRVGLEESVEWFMSTPLVKAQRKRRYHAHCLRRAAA